MTAWTGSRITGWGVALPENVVTNDDLSKTLETSDEWIRERTGIGARHVGGSTEQWATESAAKALAQAGCDPSEIDFVILATTSPDKQCPGTAVLVQNNLGLNCGAVDVQAACSGFVYGLTMAHGLIATGMKKILVIGAETMSRITDWTDRNTAILFGDGGGAVVLEATDGPDAILGHSMDAQGSLEHVLYADHDGGCLVMEGKEVFRQAVTAMVKSSRDAMEKAGVTIDDIALIVPHQANIRIIEASCKRLGAAMEKTAVVLHRTGNTSSASIPLAMVDAIENDRVNPGDLILLVGFGAGMTSAAAIVRWDP